MKLFQALLVVSVIAGCGVQDPAGPEADTLGESNSALRKSRVKFVTAERDLRKCLHGACGGWFLTDANDAAAQPVYVDALTFLTKDLAANADQLEGASPGDLILQGRATGVLVPGFEVSAAWRALPGGSAGKGDLLYQLQDGGPKCAGLWCRPKSITALNASQTTYVNSLALALQQNVHPAWVDDRVVQGRAIALGDEAKGAFTGNRVFLQLPERRGCPAIKPPACGPSAVSKQGQVATFSLDANRCLSFSACEEPGVCPLNIVAPSCTAGYVAREFLAAPGACPQLTCDAAWAE